MSQNSFVAVAGATGGMGRLVIQELSKRHVAVKALVRPGSNRQKLAPIAQLEGVSIVEVDMADGLADVLLKTQGNLLQAAVAAKVPRFIPSDFSLDFTKTQPGSNRNLDLHREFHKQLDQSGIAWTSVLNGAFMDMMAPPVSLVDRQKRKIDYVGNADQKVDWTTMADAAAFTAAVAADTNPTPRILRVASD
ncbi:hypothetical protein Micbo1qcDRAFT_221431, partial [Microdochium bolleyi]